MGGKKNSVAKKKAKAACKGDDTDASDAFEGATPEPSPTAYDIGDENEHSVAPHSTRGADGGVVLAAATTEASEGGTSDVALRPTEARDGGHDPGNSQQAPAGGNRVEPFSIDEEDVAQQGQNDERISVSEAGVNDVKTCGVDTPPPMCTADDHGQVFAPLIESGERAEPVQDFYLPGLGLLLEEGGSCDLLGGELTKEPPYFGEQDASDVQKKQQLDTSGLFREVHTGGDNPFGHADGAERVALAGGEAPRSSGGDEGCMLPANGTFASGSVGYDPFAVMSSSQVVCSTGGRVADDCFANIGLDSHTSNQHEPSQEHSQKQEKDASSLFRVHPAGDDLFTHVQQQENPFAQPETAPLPHQGAQIVPQDASGLFAAHFSGQDDPFSQVLTKPAANVFAHAVVDPVQGRAQDSSSLFGVPAQEVNSDNSATLVSHAAPQRLSGPPAEIPDLFGTPSEVPDLFGGSSSTAEDPFATVSGIVGSAEASFFDSLAPAQPQQYQHHAVGGSCAAATNGGGHFIDSNGFAGQTNVYEKGAIRELGRACSSDEVAYPWSRNLDPGTGCIYYFNAQTGVSQWEPPVKESQHQHQAKHQLHQLQQHPQQQQQQQQQQQASDTSQQHTDDPCAQHQQAAQAYPAQQQFDFSAYPQEDVVAQQQSHHHSDQQQQQQHTYQQRHESYQSTVDHPCRHDDNHHQPFQVDFGASQQTTASEKSWPHPAASAHSSWPHQQQQDVGVWEQGLQQSVPHTQQIVPKKGGYAGKIMMPKTAVSDQSQSVQRQQQHPEKAHDEQAQQSCQQQQAYEQPSLQPHHKQQQPIAAFRQRGQHPIMFFGFGGKLVVLMPKRNKNLNVFNGRPEELSLLHVSVRPGPISVFDVGTLPCMQSACSEEQAFAGPLGSSTSLKKLIQVIDDMSDAASDEDRYVNPVSQKLTWGMIKVIANNGGDLSTADVTVTAKAQDEILALLRDPLVAGGALMNAHVQNLVSPPPRDDAMLQEGARSMQELLLIGDRDAACKSAMDNELWAPALLLSSYMDIETYTRVMAEFAKRNFVVGSPLRTLYMLFAGQGAQLFEQGHVEQLLDAWQQNMSIILANRTPGDTVVMKQLGDALWHLRGDFNAAQFCYMLSGITPEAVTEAGLVDTKLVLVGADHKSLPGSFWRPASIMRTELWEHALRLVHPKCCLAALQPYKLQHAMMLVDLGKCDSALAYIEQLFNIVKPGGGGSTVFGQRFCSELEMFDHRVRVCIGGKAAASTSMGDTGFILGLRKAFDSALTSAIYGGAAPSPAAPSGVPGSGARVPQPPSQGPTEKQRAVQAAVEAREKEKKAKQEEKDRLAAERKERDDAAKQAKKDAKAAKAKARGGDDEDGKGGFLSRMLGAVAGVKQVDLGDENTLYFNEQMGCWVERGKENEVAATAAAAPPPMMASFSSNNLSQSTSFSDAGGSSIDGNSRSETPVSGVGPIYGSSPQVGVPGMPGVMLGAGLQGPSGGNMFVRQVSRGARSRYVDTLNPGTVVNGSPAAPGGMGGMPSASGIRIIAEGEGGAQGDVKPKPKYKIFVPQQQQQVERHFHPLV